MKLQNLIIGVLVVAVAVFIGMNVSKKEVIIPAQNVGAVASPDIPSPYLNWGGIKIWNRGTNQLIQGSSTVCAIQSPAGTSTLLGAGIRFNFATTAAVIVDLAKDTTPYSTTTKIGTTYTVAASQQATIIASSTGSVAGDATIFAPNTYFVVRMANGAVAGTNNVPSGVCHATWQEI